MKVPSRFPGPPSLRLVVVSAILGVVAAAWLSSRVATPVPGVLVVDDLNDVPVVLAAARAARTDVAATVIQLRGLNGQEDLEAFTDHWPTPVVMVVAWNETVADINVPDGGELWILRRDESLRMLLRDTTPTSESCAMNGVRDRADCARVATAPDLAGSATGTASDLDEVLERSDLAAAVSSGRMTAPADPVVPPAGRLVSGLVTGLGLLAAGLTGAVAINRRVPVRLQATALPEPGAVPGHRDSHDSDTSSVASGPEQRPAPRGVGRDAVPPPGRGGMLPNETLELQGFRYKPQNWIDPFTNPDPDGIEPVVTGGGSDAGRAWVLASARGTSHTSSGKPNQDRAAVRSVHQGRYLAVAVADGVGSCPLSHVGSRAMIGFALDAIEFELTAGVGPTDLDMEAIAHATTASLALAHPNEDLSRYSTTLAVAVIPRSGRVGWAGRVGDSTVLTLGEDGWRDPFPAKPGRVTEALPGNPDRAEQCAIDTSGAVIPVTDGLLDALSGPAGAQVRTLFAERLVDGLVDGQALLELITDEQIICVDDRTMVVVGPPDGGM